MATDARVHIASNMAGGNSSTAIDLAQAKASSAQILEHMARAQNGMTQLLIHLIGEIDKLEAAVKRRR